MESVGKQKKGKLSVHFSSNEHREAIASPAQFSDPSCHVDMLVDKSRSHLLIQEEVRRMMTNEINAPGMFGISADTTADLSRYDQMTIAMRYVKNMKEFGLLNK
ncbi:unnamed protein product [Lepeophtheirus salmonis]|uniref:(salmon louse) hypothetical protein n=1 Tax=Lepeophtheirus salmonis TaxID=72036 RepID=A0A7R8CSX3_LEPSM|nr:unnamed protein product [Lepeophtheirus salmonis]CAF2920419.1 unnamed protein product [Lepeophtheirus salmonis]